MSDTKSDESSVESKNESATEDSPVVADQSKVEDEQANKAIEFFTEIAERNGVACSTVSDGHVLLFDRAFMQKIINQNDEDKIMIFIKRPDFKN